MSNSCKLEKFHSNLRRNKLRKKETITSLDADSKVTNEKKTLGSNCVFSLNPNSFMFARYLKADGSAAF